MKVTDRLKQYYIESPFDDDGDVSKEYVKFYAGPYFVTLKNNDKRRSIITYHDLHHMYTGYNNSRIGEGEISAWELGTNCWNQPITVFYNLGGMATGIYYSPSRVKRAFFLGCHQRNLYDFDVEQLLQENDSDIQHYMSHTEKTPSSVISQMRYCFYFCAALSALPMIWVAGFFSEFFQKKTVSQ